MGLAERDPDMARAALLVRRSALRVDPDALASLIGLNRSEAVDRVISAPIDNSKAPQSEKSDETLTWWFKKIGASTTGLQDRMAFFWHSMIPTHRYAVGWQELVATQLNLLRSNALGNFRTMLQEFVVDGALIRYLSADRSTGKNPNENLARELMELFTVGIGNYNESDVRSAALAMSGWTVDKDTYAVAYDPERGYQEPVTFLGEERLWDVGSIVDRLCDHPATAARVANKVWYHFVGSTLDSAQASELGAWWQQQDLEIRPLLVRVFNDDRFWADHYVRARSGFEFYTSIQTIMGIDPSKTWQARNLGQVPFEPPNVGGWPVGERWLNPDALLRRSAALFNYNFNDVEGGKTATVDEILNRCGLWVVSDETVNALYGVPDRVENIGDEGIVELQWRIAMSSPEFQLQ